MIRDYKNRTKRRWSRVRTEPSFSSKLRGLNLLYLSLVVFFLAVFLFLDVRILYITKEREFRTGLLDKQRLESELLPMQLEESYLTRLEVVEKVAQEELGLFSPGKRQTRRIIIEKE